MNNNEKNINVAKDRIKYIYPRGVDESFIKDKCIDPLVFDEAHRYIKNAEGIIHLKMIRYYSDIIIATDKFAVTIRNENGDAIYLFDAFGYNFRAESIEDALKMTKFINDTCDVIERNGGNK